jgi:hypothetical protein
MKVDQVKSSADLAPMPDFLRNWPDAQASGEASKTKTFEARIPEGWRNDTLASFGGMLRNRGLGEQEMIPMLEVFNQSRLDPPVSRKEIEDVARSMMRYPPGQVPKHILHAVPPPTSNSEDWEDLQPLPVNLHPVPPLSIDLIPAPLQAWLIDIANRAQCPLEFAVVAALIALATVIGKTVTIRPKRKDDWTVVVNLWGGVVGRPGILKTPAMTEGLKPLTRLVMDAKNRYQIELLEHKLNLQKQKHDQKVIEQQIKKAVKEGKSTDELRAKMASCEAKEPTEKRYIVNDSTVEKIGELLNRMTNGLLLFRDELTGFLKVLDSAGHEADKAFYLEAWSGLGDFTYDRITRGTVYIKSVIVSILGGIQPGPLSQYLRSAMSGGTGDDGLIQRFQLMVYPNVPKDWHNVDEWPDKTARDNVFQLFKKLDSLDPTSVGAIIDDYGSDFFLRFSNEAQEYFDDWREKIERRLREGSEDHPALESHLSKYRSLMPSLALISHLLDAVSGRTTEQAVTLKSAKLAVGWCDFLFEHAKRIYGLAISAEADLARVIIRHIRRGELQNPFTARDIYSHHWSGLTNAKDVAEPLALLEDFGWIRSYSLPTGGRPTTQYFINPKVDMMNE